MTDVTDNGTILRTKLHRPSVSRDYVHRPRLFEYLDYRRERPLTLVSAPAGYGKSVLISSWLETCDIPNAWLSLDEHENDLRQFLLYFLTAIQTMFPDAVSKTMTLANASSLPPLSVLARSLANEIDSIERDFILVLDDIHCIHLKSVYDLLNELLRHPPRPMHLVLTGRKDPNLPIAFLRASKQISEIRLFDLRFTTEETAAYLQTILGEQIKEDTAATLAEKTEGWITGLRLAVLATRGHHDAVGKLLELKGSTVHVTDYLITEVLNAQPPAVRQYLLSTSILDRFSAPLCDALWVTDSERGEGVIDGAAFIAKLQKDNVFLIALDLVNRWFRYHHLFKNLLQSQLKLRCSSQEIAVLHCRAGEWYAKNGFYDEAIQHKITGGDLNEAIQIFEQNRQLMLNSNRWYVFEKWLSKFPNNVIRQRPDLMMARVWVCYFRSKNAAIPPILAAAEALLSNKPEEQPLYGEIYLFKAVFSFWQGDLSQSLKYIEGALERITETQQMVRGFAEIYFGLAGHMNGKAETVLQVLSDLLNHSSMENPRKLRVMVALVWVHILSGDLVAASSRNRQLMDAPIKNNSAAFISWGTYNQGVIHFYRNEHDSAIHYFNEAAETGYLILKRANVDCLAGLALAYQAMQQTDRANQTIARLFELIDSLNDPTLLEIAYACEGRLSLMRGEAALAHRLLHPAQASDEQPMVFWLEVPAITNCRLLIADGTDTSLKEAEKRLTSYLRLNRTHHNTFRVIELMALQSQAVCRQGRLKEALTLLGQAIKIAEPGGCVQPFVELGPPMADLLKRLHRQNVAVDIIERILATPSDSEQVVAPLQTAPSSVSTDQPLRPSPPSQPLVEPLTNRELDVLELLAQRLQNKEIAEKLFIADGTVKAHLKKIYQKLNVSKRRQAVEKAKALGILFRY